MSEPPNGGSEDDRLARSPWLSCERVGGEGILHDQRGGRVHVLNESATRVWELCAGHPTVAELTAALANSYGMPASAVEADVLAILRELREKGCLEPSGAIAR